VDPNGDPNGDGKYKILPSPHKSPECVDLCGIGGVGGLIDPHRLKRCVMNIVIFISRYTWNFSLHSIYYVPGSIQNMPIFNCIQNTPNPKVDTFEVF
jgi:hypothetical protein